MSHRSADATGAAFLERIGVPMILSQAQKFDERGLNVIVPAGQVDVAFLSDPPPAGVQILQTAGVDIQPV